MYIASKQMRDFWREGGREEGREEEVGGEIGSGEKKEAYGERRLTSGMKAKI